MRPYLQGSLQRLSSLRGAEAQTARSPLFLRSLCKMPADSGTVLQRSNRASKGRRPKAKNLS